MNEKIWKNDLHALDNKMSNQIAITNNVNKNVYLNRK